jgi:hypothetical protein
VGRPGKPMTQTDLCLVIISNSIYRKPERVDKCIFLTSTYIDRLGKVEASDYSGGRALG